MPCIFLNKERGCILIKVCTVVKLPKESNKGTIFTLIDRRPYFFYTLQDLVSVLSVLSLYIPKERKKIGRGLTILLAQIVNLIIVLFTLPSSSQNFPEIGETQE